MVTRIKRYRHAKGHYILVRLSAAVVRDRAGKVLGTIAVIEDVTAEQQAEEAVVQQARIYHTIARNIPRGAVPLFDRDLRYLAADGAELLTSIGLEREEIERLPCPGVGHVTVSAGVSSLVAGEPIAALVKRADERLYAAKAAGRNRVVAAAPARDSVI